MLGSRLQRKPNFDTTKWSMVLKARDASDPRSRDALCRLCEAYWYPLYFFVRRQGHQHQDALDLTQGYFAMLLEKQTLKDVRPDAGRFRSFLLTSLKHFIAHERDKSRAQKRGGNQTPLSLDEAAAERRYDLEPSDNHTPDKAFEVSWARTVLERARRKLETEFIQMGKQNEFQHLSPFLAGDLPERPYREVAERLETTEAALKMAIMRLRRRFGRVLREEIADTVDRDEEIDLEVKALLVSVRDE